MTNPLFLDAVMNPKRSRARQACAVVHTVHTEGMSRGVMAVAHFNRKWEKNLCAAVLVLCKSGVLQRQPCARGEIAVTPGPAWDQEVAVALWG